MSDINEWIATGTIADVEHKEFNDKSFIEVTINSRNYKGENVQIPFSIWGNAVEKFTANVGDFVAVKGEARSKQNGQYLNVSLSAYAVEVLSAGAVDEIDIGDDDLF